MSTDTAAAPAAVSDAPLALLTRAEILDRPDAIFKTESVPEWGGAVRLKSLSIADRMELENRMAINKAAKPQPRPELDGIGEWLLTRACVDAMGRPIFTADDAKVLSDRNAVVVQRLIGVVIKMADAEVGAAAKN